MRKLMFGVAAFLSFSVAAEAAEVLVVIEKRGIDRWETGSPEWKRVGAFLDAGKSGLQPISITATADGKVYVSCESKGSKWTIEEFSSDGRHLRTVARLKNRPFTVMAHPDGRRLVQAFSSSELKSYDIADGREHDYIVGAPYGSRCVRFGPDGNCWVSSVYTGKIAAFDGAAVDHARKLGELTVFCCNGGFDFGGKWPTKLLVPSMWYESVDLLGGVTDVSYPEDQPMRWCQSTVRVGGEVYAADFASGGIVHMPSKPGKVTVVAKAPGMISSMVNLTEARDGSDRRRFDSVKAKLSEKGRRLFLGEPNLPAGQRDLERMKFNHPGLEVDLSVGIWPRMRVYGDGVAISSTSVPRELVRRYRRTGAVKYDAGTETTWAKQPTAVNDVRPPYAGPPWAKAHFRANRGCSLFYVDMTGDGLLDAVEIYSDWSEYGLPGPPCPLAYDREGNWTNNHIQAFAYLYRREGGGKDGKWSKPEPILSDGKRDLQGSFSTGGAAFADFNGDGLVDMIGGDFRSEIWYYENVGTREKPAFAAGRHPTDEKGKAIEGALCMMNLQGYDYDGDGRLDLMVTEEDGRASWFRNLGKFENGVPIFAQQEFFRQEADELKFGCLATPVAVDWDGDGDEDLVCGDSLGHIGFIENLSGKGVERPKWAEPVLFTVRNPQDCRVPLWLEGKVICARCGDNNSPQGPAEAKWGYTVLSVADWDNDGFPDIMANDVKGSVVFIRNPGKRGTTEMEAPRAVEVEWEGEQPRFAWEWRKPTGKALRAMWRTTPLMYDWTGDGLKDLIMLDHEGHLALYPRARKNGRLVLLPPKRVFLDEHGRSQPMCDAKGASGRRKFCITDWNGDGRPDFVFQAANAFVRINLGTDADGRTRFRDTRQIARKRLAGHTCCPTVCDFNADGVPDIVLGAEDGHFYYYRNPRSVAEESARGANVMKTSPDYVVYVPQQAPNRRYMDPKRTGDSYNDHFQVLWDDARKLYYAFWTQGSWEGAGDHHICFSKSADRGKTWTKAEILAGSVCRAHKGIDASWQQPMLSKSGRLYCLWNFTYDGGYRLWGFYSDDAGETWSDPKRMEYQRPKYTHAFGWINWQRPLRLGVGGRYFVGSSLCDAVEFWEFDNLDENPGIRDLKITYLSREMGERLGGERMKEKPKYFMPVGKTSPVLAESGLVKLPDGRLFSLMRSSVGHPIWSESRDQGRTWSDPKILRERDGGREYLHPCSPCPIYDYEGCEKGSGRYIAFIHDTFDFANTNTHYQTRGPYYLLAGKFNAKAKQPIEFALKKLFIGNTGGWNSMYSSYTVVDGKHILWYPDRKYFLVGREIGEEWLRAGK